MGQEAMPSTVAFSWEHEPGVSKESPRGAHETPAEGPRKAPTHWLSVPPPPGGPAMSAARGLDRNGRAIRPEDDPFLAAYLACTKSGKKGGSSNAREPKGQRRFSWAGLGLGVGLGISCKSASGVVESMVRLAKPPEMDPRDA